MNCDQCKLRFNTKERRPIVSDCGHTICEKCRDRLEKCPECKSTMDKSRWIVNHTLIKMLEIKGDGADVLVSICFIGDIAVGKSCLMMRLCQLGFIESIATTTVGLDYKMVDVDINGLNFRFQMWDTAGQERYHSANTLIYRKIDIVIVVFQATEPYNQKKYDQIIAQYCKENVSIIYVVNKIDLTHNFQRRQNYHYASCKTNEGISQIWSDITKIAAKIPKQSIKLIKQTEKQVILPKKERTAIKTENRGQKINTGSGGGGCSC